MSLAVPLALMIITMGLAATATADHRQQQQSVERGDTYLLVVPPHCVGPAARLNILGILDIQLRTWSYSGYPSGYYYSQPNISGYGRYYYFSSPRTYSYGGYGYSGGYSGGYLQSQQAGGFYDSWTPRGDGTYTVTHHWGR